MNASKRRFLWIGLGLTGILLTVGVFWSRQPPWVGFGDAGWRRQQEENIQETVFRHMFKDYHVNKGLDVIFLRVNDDDPSDSLLKRFAEYKPRKASQQVIRPPGDVQDKITGEKGSVWQIESISWVDNTHTRLRAGYAASTEAACFCTYRAEWKQDKWVIVEKSGCKVS